MPAQQFEKNTEYIIGPEGFLSDVGAMNDVKAINDLNTKLAANDSINNQETDQDDADIIQEFIKTNETISYLLGAYEVKDNIAPLNYMMDSEQIKDYIKASVPAGTKVYFNSDNTFDVGLSGVLQNEKVPYPQGPISLLDLKSYFLGQDNQNDNEWYKTGDNYVEVNGISFLAIADSTQTGSASVEAIKFSTKEYGNKLSEKLNNINLDSLFDIASSKIKTNEISEIDNNIDGIISSLQAGSTLTLKGYVSNDTNAQLDSDKPGKLSENRANAIKEYIISKLEEVGTGELASQIVIGESENGGIGTRTENKELDRRVDFEFSSSTT